MRRTSLRRSWLALNLTFLLGFAGQLEAGPLVNGSFDNFDGWSAKIRDSVTDDDSDVDPAADSRFSLVGAGFARLSNDFDYYEVALFQSFRLAPSATTLSFAYDWSLTAQDPQSPDLVQALLRLAGVDDCSQASDCIQLFPLTLDTSAASPPPGDLRATTDVSGFAGLDVTIEFLVQDGDFQEDDWLEIGNIEITEAPIPTSLALLLVGFGPLLGSMKRRLARCPRR